MIALVLAHALAFALQAADVPPSPENEDIVVLGERLPSLRERIRVIARQIDEILPPTATDQPYARFGDPVCPGLVGLSRESAQAVVDRVGLVADTLGLRVGQPGCDPNLLVIVTADTAAAVRRLTTRRQANFNAQSLADIRRLHREPGLARGWTETEVRSRDGERPAWDGQGPPELSLPTASRVALGFRRDIVSAVVMIDADAVEGRDPIQIADYAAMRGLAGVRPDRPRVADSILTAFTPDGDAAAPKRLTETDWGILRGLYEGQGNRPSGIKRATMVRHVLAIEDERQDRPENERE